MSEIYYYSNYSEWAMDELCLIDEYYQRNAQQWIVKSTADLNSSPSWVHYFGLANCLGNAGTEITAY